MCSGSYHAVEAALAGPTASVCLINPVLEYSRWGGHPYRTFEPEEGSEGLTDREAWGSTRPFMTRLMVRLAPLRRVTQRLPGSTRWFVKRLLMTATPARTLGQLDQAGIDVLVVTGEREDGLMRRGEERKFRALLRKGRVKIESIANLEHTLLERTGRDQAAEKIHAYVIGRVAGPGGPVTPACGRERAPAGAGSRWLLLKADGDPLLLLASVSSDVMTGPRTDRPWSVATEHWGKGDRR